MLKRVVTLGLTGLAAAAMTASPAAASSHREAPLISNDPVADLADTFMWVDQKDPSKLNLVMTANPLENPGDAPNYYGFGQHVRYQFNIDNNGDARADISYRVVFTTHVRNKGTFLYNIPGNPVTSLSDPGLNVYQTYSVDRLNYGKHGKLVGTVHLAKNLKTVPNNVGPGFDAQLPPARQAGREASRRTRREGVGRPVRRPVLHRARRHRRQPPGEAQGRRQGHPRWHERPGPRASGAEVAHREEGPPDDRHVRRDRSAVLHERAHGHGPRRAGCRSSASATRS